MNKVKTMTVDIMENNYTRKTLFKVLLFGLIILGIIYIYLVGSITFNVLARKSLENTLRSFSSNISNLELIYLENLNKIDKDYAMTKGFVDAKSNIFATRTISHVAIR